MQDTPPIHFKDYALLHRILCRGFRRSASRIPLFRWGKGGLFKPMGGRGIPETPPAPIRGGMIEFQRERGRGIPQTPPLHDRNISTNRYPEPTLETDQHY
jgi:hypothetical protein